MRNIYVVMHMVCYVGILFSYEIILNLSRVLKCPKYYNFNVYILLFCQKSVKAICLTEPVIKSYRPLERPMH